MFVRLKTTLETDIIINADHISTVQRFATPSQEGCEITFVNNSDSIRVLNTIEQLDMLLDVNSIEKIVDSLKRENFELRRRQMYDQIMGEFMGGKQVAETKHSQD